ncbi:hypothetical protein Tco_1513177, partial [Tanacetum coccineum]
MVNTRGKLLFTLLPPIYLQVYGDTMLLPTRPPLLVADTSDNHLDTMAIRKSMIGWLGVALDPRAE